MENIEKDVLLWHKKTFPNATKEAIIDKFLEELDEFEIEIATGTKTDMFTCNGQDEFVDMCIVYMAGLNKLGLPALTDLIRDKLEVNKKRKWGKETSNGDRPRDK